MKVRKGPRQADLHGPIKQELVAAAFRREYRSRAMSIHWNQLMGFGDGVQRDIDR